MEQKKSIVKYLICFQIYYLLIIGFLTDVVHVPSVLRYVLDVNLIFLILYSFSYFPRIKRVYRIESINPIFKYIIVYTIAVLVYAVIVLVPFPRIFWAFRNNLFFVIFFALCIFYMNMEDMKKTMKIVVRFQIFNVLCIGLEYYMGYRADFLGGMFGTAQGCNGILIGYLLVISVYSVCAFASKKMHILEVLFVIASTLVISALSELKVMYVEVLLIAILQFALSTRKLKSLGILLGVIVFAAAGIAILYAVSPFFAGYFNSLDSILGDNSQFKDGDLRLGRFSFFSQVNELFFKGDPIKNLFGYGYGYCESSKTFSFFNSDFATKYEEVTGYRNISGAVLFLETGILGTLAFAGIFVMIFVLGFRYRNKTKKFSEIIVSTQILCILIIVNFFYNASIRREIAYLIFFMLSYFFIMIKDADSMAKYKKLKPSLIEK